MTSQLPMNRVALSSLSTMATTSTDLSAAQRHIAAQLDTLPLSRAHIKTMIMAGFGPFFEAFDQANIVYVYPRCSSLSASPPHKRA
jgi:hypothetical protein